jgi:hypothetical protein
MNKKSKKKLLLSEQKRPKTNSRAKILRNSLMPRGLQQKILGGGAPRGGSPSRGDALLRSLFGICRFGVWGL